MRGAHRRTQRGGASDDQCARRLAHEPVQRPDPVDAATESPHDPPPTHGRPDGEGDRADQLHPQRHHERGNRARGHEGQRDQTHRLLGVVRPVSEGESRGRHPLTAQDRAGHAVVERAAATARPRTRPSSRQALPQPGRWRVRPGLRPPQPDATRRSPPQCTAPRPPTATPAPTSPPTSACEDDDGNPHHHVARFHITAARRDGEQDPQRVGRPDADEATDRVGHRSTSQDRPQDREDRRHGHRGRQVASPAWPPAPLSSSTSHGIRWSRRTRRRARRRPQVRPRRHRSLGQCPSLRAWVGTSWQSSHACANLVSGATSGWLPSGEVRRSAFSAPRPRALLIRRR